MQTPAPFEYERATSVDGAIAALDRLGPEARVIAGGHSLLPMMKLRLANPARRVADGNADLVPETALEDARDSASFLKDQLGRLTDGKGH